MIQVLGVLYGVHVIFLIYFMSYLGARGILRGGVIPFGLILLKYFIYWAVIAFGFKVFPAWPVVTGLIAGIYLSLPVLYWWNRKVTEEDTLPKSRPKRSPKK